MKKKEIKEGTSDLEEGNEEGDLMREDRLQNSGRSPLSTSVPLSWVDSSWST